jgi:DMSO/TMAO reductase YedYZ molybdopterin-dependent catalytic subunit
MSTAAVDRLLAILLAAQLITGLISLRAGEPGFAPLFWLHGLLAGALLVAAIEKLRRSLGPALRARRWGRLLVGGTLTALVAAALVGGFGWVASGRLLSIGPWTVLTLHAWAALAVVPIAVVHLLPHRWRLLRVTAAGPRISRRTALAGVGMVAIGAVAWGAANVADRLLGGIRRFTGSRWLPDGGIPPPTTFLGEGTPRIETSAWRLRVAGQVERELLLDLEDLAALGTETRAAALDCTSGWVMRTDWHGTPLGRVLDAAGADPESPHVTVRSVTGWLVRLAPDELDGALLATHVAGRPLPSGNGAPLRLVAPERRGLDWIKWVEAIEVA